jgi:hypothetical protein
MGPNQVANHPKAPPETWVAAFYALHLLISETNVFNLTNKND